jgi:hypothetical protein
MTLPERIPWLPVMTVTVATADTGSCRTVSGTRPVYSGRFGAPPSLLAWTAKILPASWSRRMIDDLSARTENGQYRILYA